MTEPKMSEFKMIDVSEKATTRRRAIARGKILLAPLSFIALKEGTNPKGNVLAMAEVAGIMAAKKTSDALPLCHPLPLQSVRFHFELDCEKNTVEVQCEAITAAQTGVEMEALSGVNGALLAIYDLSKAVDPTITILEMRLDLKEGGKSGVWKHPASLGTTNKKQPPREAPTQNQLALSGVRAAVITVSDRGHAGETQDRSGPIARAQLEEWGANVVASTLVQDEKRKIQAALHTMIEDHRATLIITTGGTGLSPRDVTPEAIEEIADRMIPGIGECLRGSGARHIDTAWLSRSLGAQIGSTWIIALPGSPNAVSEGLVALLPLLAHGVHVAHGGRHD
jgi:molybdenum cofactor biosynthesis protein MoaC